MSCQRQKINARKCTINTVQEVILIKRGRGGRGSNMQHSAAPSRSGHRLSVHHPSTAFGSRTRDRPNQTSPQRKETHKPQQARFRRSWQGPSLPAPENPGRGCSALGKARPSYDNKMWWHPTRRGSSTSLRGEKYKKTDTSHKANSLFTTANTTVTVTVVA